MNGGLYAVKQQWSEAHIWPTVRLVIGRVNSKKTRLASNITYCETQWFVPREKSIVLRKAATPSIAYYFPIRETAQSAF